MVVPRLVGRLRLEDPVRYAGRRGGGPVGEPGRGNLRLSRRPCYAILGCTASPSEPGSIVAARLIENEHADQLHVVRQEDPKLEQDPEHGGHEEAAQASQQQAALPRQKASTEPIQRERQRSRYSQQRACRTTSRQHQASVFDRAKEPGVL